MPEKAYNDDYPRQAYKLCLLNAVDREIADFFEVSQRTITGWKEKHPEFAEAMKAGKMMSDSEVALKLFQRATGSTVKKQKVLNSGDIIDYTEELPPDTKAAEFWLNCRTKNNDRPWTPKNQTELSGSEDNPLAFVLNEVAAEAESGSRLPSQHTSDPTDD